jgi:hypothetical protein
MALISMMTDIFLVPIFKNSPCPGTVARILRRHVLWGTGVNDDSPLQVAPE